MLIVSVNLFLMRIVSVLFSFWEGDEEGEERKIEHWRAPMNNCQTNTSWRTTTKSRTRILDFPSHYCFFFDVAVVAVIDLEFCFHLTCHSFVFSSAITYRLFHAGLTAHYKSCVRSPVFERTHTRHSSSNMNSWFFSFYLPRSHPSTPHPGLFPRQSIESTSPRLDENELVPPFPRRLISMAIVVLVSCRPDEDI
jgi:hypothetical protein